MKVVPILQSGELEGSKGHRVIQLTQQPIYFNERNCTVLSFADITDIKKLAFVEM